MPRTPGQILIIGYGNPLRGDDGLGQIIANHLDRVNQPGVTTLSVFQLTPELSEPIAAADVVYFVDAGVDGPCPVTLVPVEAAVDSPWGTHLSTPSALLNLANTLFGKAPRAWLLTVRGHDFTLQEGLSTAAERNVRLAVDHLQEHIAQIEKERTHARQDHPHPGR